MTGHLFQPADESFGMERIHGSTVQEHQILLHFIVDTVLSHLDTAQVGSNAAICSPYKIRQIQLRPGHPLQYGKNRPDHHIKGHACFILTVSVTSLTSISNILVSEKMLEDRAKQGKPATQTIAAYVNALKEAYLFYEIKRFDIKGKEELKPIHARRYSLYLNTVMMEEILSPDVQLLSFNTLQRILEERIVDGKLQEVLEINLGYLCISRNAAEQKDELS